MDANAPASSASLEEDEAGELCGLGAAKVEVEITPGLFGKTGTQSASVRLCAMNDARRLQRLCEKQAALTDTERVKVVLREIAEEYRVQAEREDEREPRVRKR
ncbi:hypothetical protein [Bradyrhizobium sp. F1.13.3]|uniref:hypothetical protein n=1 Tax=Bradyrhizobium sp. F1.13.3 TaxID=3156351 RepID=UPI003394D7B3